MSDMFLDALTATPTRAPRESERRALPPRLAAEAQTAADKGNAVLCAIELLTTQGYRITKPRAVKPKCATPALNAIGKPYGASYDPKYRMKYHPRRYAYP